MTTIKIQPPIIKVPDGPHCNPFKRNRDTCAFLAAITSTWWCLFEGREHPLEWDVEAMSHFKRPGCLAACAAGVEWIRQQDTRDGGVGGGSGAD